MLPTIRGGARIIVDTLSRALEARGHDVEVWEIPFWSNPDEMFSQMLGLRELDVSTLCDRLICIRTPSYLIRHPSKVVWFIHHHRGAYDLWGTPFGDLEGFPGKERFRDIIRSTDDIALREASALFANSKVVADRLARFNNISANVLYPPLAEDNGFCNRGYGDFILYVSRIVGHKRQRLVVEAMAETASEVRLVIAGAADNKEELTALRNLVDQLGLEGRVEIRAKWITEEEKIDLMSHCLGVVYAPFDEDSYGYPSLEACTARKCVVTTTDSGGVSELVVDGRNGLVVAPDPLSLGAAFDRLFHDRALAERLGRSGPIRIAELGIDWDTVCNSLLKPDLVIDS